MAYPQTRRIEHPNLADKVYAILKEDILKNKLPAGTRIDIQRFGQENGVSKTPMREALVRLQNEGYVVSVPRGGTYVRELSEQEVRDIYEIRESLEALAIHLAVRRISDDQVAELRETCEAYRQAIEQGQISRCMRHDLAFHRQLAEASGNQKLVELMEGIHQRVGLMISRGSDYWKRANASLNDHLAICNALASGDGNRGATVISEHIRRGKEALFD